MSSIPAKSLDGDISVGRNSNIGGNAVVRGCVTIGHNMKVEGWLHAPNIKGACKGYFLSLTDLNDAYPAPADGDYAFVSESGLPGPIYIAKNGVWTDSGKTGGPSLDSNDIDDLRKEVAEYSGSIDAIDKAQETLRADFDTHVQDASKEIAAVKTTADTAAAEVAIAKEQAAAAVSTANEANTTANEAKNAAQIANDKANAAKSAAETANTTASAAAKSAAAAAETAAGAVTAINTLKTENTADHTAIRKEATDALAAHAAANDKAFADEASARKAVSGALTAHEKTDAADHAAIRKTLSDSLASAKQEQHDTLGVSGIVAFDGFVGDVSNDNSETGAPIVRDPRGKVQQGAATVHFSTADCNFLIKQDGTYYPTWTDDYMWQDAHQTPWRNKAYYNVNDGKLYKIGTDNQLHEIALTALRDDIGILPCRVRTAAPRAASPTTGYPTAHNYTIWWSQTSKAFFAAEAYDQAVDGDAIEGREYYPLSVCDEYTDYCTVSGSGSTQTAVPRADRIFRSSNDLWQYDKASGRMVKVGDISGGTYGNVHLTGFCEAEMLDAQQIAAALVKANMAQFDKTDETAALTNTVIVQAQARGMSIDWQTSYKTKRVMTLKNMRDEMIYTDGQETLMLGDDDSPLDVTGVRTLTAESVSAKADVSAKAIHATGDIDCFGEVSGQVVHGDSATFCQGNEVKIDINGNISTEKNLTVEGTASLEGGATVGGELTCDGLTANSAEVSGKVMANSVEADGDVIAGGSVKTSTIVPGTGSGGAVEVDGQLVTKGWGIMANGDSGIVGNLTVSGAAYADGLHADKVLHLDKEDVGAMLVHVFHGIRQNLPTDYTAATLPLTPKTRTDGEADIIYVREKKRFYAFWESQKAYAERFDGEAEYNVINNNKPTTARTDRTWQMNGKLYAWDAEFALKDPNNLLSAYVGDLTCLNDSAKEAFIKSWTEAFYKNGRKFGEYNRETGYFEGNGLTDITYEQAKIIMKFVGICQNPSSIWRKIDGGYSHGGLGNFRFDYYGKGQDSRGPRTFPPIVNGASGGVYNSNHLLQGDICLQAASFAGSGGLTGNEYVFDSCRNLRYVLNMELNDTQGKKTGMFAGCVALETVELKYLTQGTVSFEQSPKLTLDSIKYMLNNRRKDGDMLSNEKYKFTIKLHADVFAKLTDDIIALATEMNATLVSA